MTFTYDPTPPSRPSAWLRYALPAVVLLVGILLTAWLMATGPQAKKRPRERQAPLVEVREVHLGTEPTQVAAMGTVVPSREVQLTPQVSGRIVALSPEFQPGGQLRAGERLVQVDPSDYRLAVDQLRGEVAQAESELRLEEGNQLVARKEFELFGEQVSPAEQELMLRQPQLGTLQAAVVAARARLEQARLDLERTAVSVPFNALVVSREVDLGANVAASTVIGRLVAQDAFWVEVAVPVRQLRWIEIPRHNGDQGATARVFDEAAWGAGHYREGRVIRLAASLEEQGRLARLLVEVPDPLARRPENLGKPRMLLDAFVRVEIDGQPLEQVAVLSREELRDGDTAWVLNGDGKLEIRSLEVPFRGERQVLVSGGLNEGDRLVVTNLGAPVAGMALRTSETETETGGGTRP